MAHPRTASGHPRAVLKSPPLPEICKIELSDTGSSGPGKRTAVSRSLLGRISVSTSMTRVAFSV